MFLPLKNQNLYVVCKSKKEAKEIANSKIKKYHSVSKIYYLADSLNLGNTLFTKEGKK